MSLTPAHIEITVTKKTVVTSSRGYWKGGRYISKGATGHWSKWGGARMDVIQAEVSDVWHCQSCRNQQPKDLSPYKYEFPKGEYIRVCAPCIVDGCSSLKIRLGL